MPDRRSLRDFIASLASVLETTQLKVCGDLKNIHWMNLVGAEGGDEL